MKFQNEGELLAWVRTNYPDYDDMEDHEVIINYIAENPGAIDYGMQVHNPPIPQRSGSQPGQRENIRESMRRKPPSRSSDAIRNMGVGEPDVGAWFLGRKKEIQDLKFQVSANKPQFAKDTLSTEQTYFLTLIAEYRSAAAHIYAEGHLGVEIAQLENQQAYIEQATELRIPWDRYAEIMLEREKNKTRYLVSILKL